MSGYAIGSGDRPDPVRSGVVIGVISGVPFGVAMMLMTAFFMLVMEPHRPTFLTSVLLLSAAGVSTGAFFGAGMGAWFAMGVGRWPQPEPLSAGAGSGTLRQARRLVRAGLPGADPELNRIGSALAQRELAFPYFPKTQAAVFLAFGTLSAWQAVRGYTADNVTAFPVIHTCGAVMFAACLGVLIPLQARQRRRAREFLAGTEGDRP